MLRISCLCLFVFTSVTLSCPAQLTTATFTGVDGDSWNDSSHWSTGSVPSGSLDEAVISDALTVNLTAIDPTLGSLVLTDSAHLASTRTTTTTAFTFGAATLSGSGQLTAATITNDSSGGTHVIDGTTLEVSDSFTWDNGDIELKNNATLHILSGASFTPTGTVSLTNTSGGTLLLDGTLTKNDNSTSSLSPSTFTIGSSGTLQVQSGSLTLANAFSSSGTVTVADGATLTNYNGFTQSAGSLTLEDSASLTIGNLTLNGGTFSTGSATVSFGGGLTLAGGTFDSTANRSIYSGVTFFQSGTVQGGGTLDVVYTQLTTSADKVIDGSTFTTANGGVWSGGDIVLNNSATFQIAGGGLNVSASNTSIGGDGTGSLVLNGAFSKSSSDRIDVDVAVTAGTAAQISNQAGTLAFNAGGDFSGTLQNSSGATLEFTGTHTFSDNGNVNYDSLSDSGTLVLMDADTSLYFGSGANYQSSSASTFALSTGSITVAGGGAWLRNPTMTLSGGAFTAGDNSGETASVTFGNLTQSGGTLTTQGKVDLSFGTVVISGGTFNVGHEGGAIDNSFTVSGGTVHSTTGVTLSDSSLDFTAGTLSGDSTFTLANLTLSGAGGKTVDQAALSTSTGSWTSSNVDFDQNASLTIRASGGFNIYGEGTLGGDGTGRLNVEGALIKQSGDTSNIDLEVDFGADSQLSVKTGTLALRAGGTIDSSTFSVLEGATLALGGSINLSGDITGDGSIDLLSGGTLGGSGSIAMDLLNYANVGLQSTLDQFTFGADYRQDALGVLNADLFSTNSFDLFTITGAATLDGTLNLSADSSFLSNAQVGDQFELITWSSYSGSFVQVNGLTLSSSRYLEVSYAATGLTVTLAASAVPEPATYGLGLGLVGLLTVAGRRRRTRSHAWQR